MSNASNFPTPNLLLAGAPKCGTTSLANYLAEHPQIFFSLIKEPYYWASDLPEMRQSERIESLSDYLRLFECAKPSCKFVAEASTLYLFSDSAIPDSLRFNPAMKYIVMIRRPQDVAHAFHMQMCFQEAENEPDFQSAWRLQERRRKEEIDIAARCKSPRLLQYRQVAALGSQLERAMRNIPGDQLHVILFDDFVKNTRQVYNEALNFLTLNGDNRSSFPRDNAAMKSNNVLLTRMMRSRYIRKLTLSLKRTLKGPAYDVARAFKRRLMFRESKRKDVSPQFAKELNACFRPEIEKLESLLDRDLTHWK